MEVKATPNELQTKTGTEQVDQKKTDILQPGIKKILWGGSGLLVLLLILTFALPAGRILFFTGSMLSLVTLVVIAMQSLIYSGQWKAMNEALAEAKRQTEIAGASFTINSQAYVCVHDARLDLETATIFVLFENLGKIPAEDISVEIEMNLKIPEAIGKGNAHRKDSYEWGALIQLFSGQLKLELRIPPEKWLTIEQHPFLNDDRAKLTLNGTLTFYDGFLPREPKRTHFALRYRPTEKRWFVQRIIAAETKSNETQENDNAEQ